jgi:aspartate-semialdehyde dehydrogenase
MFLEEFRVLKNLAVVGATGAVGGLVLEMIESRALPYKSIKFLASARSAGKTIRFKGKDHPVEVLSPESFRGVDIAIASTPDETAREFVPWAKQLGTIVVDESGAWRMDPKVPLVVPEVNPEALKNHEGLIASPNCSTTQMVVALKPLHDAARVKRVIVSTYQATSGMGVSGQRELDEATKASIAGQPFTHTAFKHNIAFNLIPQIGGPKHEGYTSEEMKMVWETQKILGDDSIRVCPTCVRVPVSNCHSESILVETERKLTVAEARKLFESFPGITVIDNLNSGEYPMPNTATGKDDVFIGRIREDLSFENGLAFWCVSDNLRKGAATNAVQIAELLVKVPTAVRV